MPGQQAPAPPPTEFLVFDAFEGGMNTQSGRPGLPEKFASWMENLQPVAGNYLLGVKSPVAALTTLTGEITVKSYAATIGTQDYLVYFCASGAAYALSVTGGPGDLTQLVSVTKFAPAGTFSAGGGDLTTYNGTRILIADSVAGYCTWDGTLFVEQGGVSPNFSVTAGGSGYTSGATVAISGGSGSGATAVAVLTAGSVTGITLTNPGTGYLAGDTLTVTITPVGAGSGATATGHVWPFLTPSPITVAVAFGRVWLAVARTLICTGTGSASFGAGYDDFSPSDGSVSTTVSDSDLIHQITVLRFLEGFLYIIGDNSVKSIGSITLSGGITNFTITPLSSDQGTLFPNSVVSFNRLVLFANTTGVFAVFGASVEKISDAMDGIFRGINFSQPPQGAVNDVNNIHTFLLLVKYNDPVAGLRSLILCYFNKRWFVMSQGSGLVTLCSAVLGGHYDTFGSSGSDATQLIQGSAALAYKLQTALTTAKNPVKDKKISRLGIAQTVTGVSDMLATVDTESASINTQLTNELGPSLTIVNNFGATLTILNNVGATLTITGAGFILSHTANFNATGRYVGATLTGTLSGIAIQGIFMEYSWGALWGRG